ncbi:MAG: hemerythrin domain-containing protein [Actinobacteria bacterium]|nr:hemerythrin domain-containing protein [Actinomycetota bacterium]
MCHYCGCREMPLLRDYIAEHERAINFGGEAVRAIDRGDLARAGHLLAEMATELAAHWLGEETGLFRVMAREEMYAEHITPLVREHRELAALLATVDISSTDGQQAIREAVSDLYEHISKEEDGLFPASLTALDGDEWDASIDAWHDAHPGRHMIAG